MKILVVDDNVQIRVLMHDLLAEDHELSILTNGYNAVCLLSDIRHGFDLVFLDIRMPGLSGDQVLEILNDFKDTRTRFVVISGYADHKFIPKYKNVMEFLEKPINVKDIERIVEEVEKKVR